MTLCLCFCIAVSLYLCVCVSVSASVSLSVCACECACVCASVCVPVLRKPHPACSSSGVCEKHVDYARRGPLCMRITDTDQIRAHALPHTPTCQSCHGQRTSRRVARRFYRTPQAPTPPVTTLTWGVGGGWQTRGRVVMAAEPRRQRATMSQCFFRTHRTPAPQAVSWL